MLKNGRGVLCAPITEERCEELGLGMQVAHNTSTLETPFTVTVDRLGMGCTTGVSIYDRAQTIRALADPTTNLPTSVGRGTSTRCGPVRAVCCVAPDTPKPPSTWRAWPDSIPPVH